MGAVSIDWNEEALRVLKKVKPERHDTLWDEAIVSAVSNGLYEAHFKGYHLGVETITKLQQLETQISAQLGALKPLLEAWKKMKELRE